eukprot:4589772-Pleurochrysis_carterae.AAC.5
MGAQPSMDVSDARNELEGGAPASGGALCGLSANHFSAPELDRLDDSHFPPYSRNGNHRGMHNSTDRPPQLSRHSKSFNERPTWHRTKEGTLVAGHEVSDTESELSECCVSSLPSWLIVQHAPYLQASTPSSGFKRTFSQSSDLSEHERRHDVNTWPLRRQRVTTEPAADSGQMDLWEVTRSLSRERNDVVNQLEQLTAGSRSARGGASSSSAAACGVRGRGVAAQASASDDFLARDLQQLVEQV